MIELDVIDYLKKQFPDIKVREEPPSGMKTPFITVEKTGSQQISIGLYQSTIAIQSWESTKYNASKLSNEVCKAMRNISDYVPAITKSRGSDYDFTDTTTKNYRYQALFTITHYGG